MYEMEAQIELPVGMGMVPADLRRYKKLLLEKRSGLSDSEGDAQAPVPSAGGWDGDSADQANADADAELHVRLHQTDGRLLRAIEEALDRIGQGTFGICVVCKQSIPKVRLDAVPWTHLCLKCKEGQRA
jgi:RNA polymerase-binding protein DksA